VPFFSIKKGKLLISHRSTTYPCCDQALGDSVGAGRIRLARGKGKDILKELSNYS